VLTERLDRGPSSDHNGLGVVLKGLAPSELLQLAQKAERNRFKSAWFAEITFGDAVTPAAAAAVGTQRLLLVPSIIGIWSRSPVAAALTASSLAELSDGRLRFGVGLQAHTYVSEWHGRTFERPLRAMREYLTIVRGILSGERVTFDGEIFQVKNFQLRAASPDRRIPIYVAATGPRMVELGAELADGVIGAFYSEQYIRAVVLPSVLRGAEKAGKAPEDVEVGCVPPSIITRDDSGLELIKGQVVMFSTALRSSPGYADCVTAAGFGDELRTIHELVARGDVDAAVRSVPDAMADALTISGRPENAWKRIQAFRESGLTTIALNPSPPGIYFPLHAGHFPEGVKFPPFSFPAYRQVIADVISLMGER
jgi:alkanesulfonate monooxygenase SsuD/methylene tetrahydromethanopterin reductase-like flavin-dependent oxidoreductase (luciferase family)